MAQYTDTIVPVAVPAFANYLSHFKSNPSSHAVSKYSIRQVPARHALSQHQQKQIRVFARDGNAALRLLFSRTAARG